MPRQISNPDTFRISRRQREETLHPLQVAQHQERMTVLRAHWEANPEERRIGESRSEHRRRLESLRGAR